MRFYFRQFYQLCCIEQEGYLFLGAFEPKLFLLLLLPL